MLLYSILILPYRYRIWSVNISALKQVYSLYHKYPTYWIPFDLYLYLLFNIAVLYIRVPSLTYIHLVQVYIGPSLYCYHLVALWFLLVGFSLAWS